MERQNKSIYSFIGVEELLYLSQVTLYEKKRIWNSNMYQKEQDLTLEITQ